MIGLAQTLAITTENSAKIKIRIQVAMQIRDYRIAKMKDESISCNYVQVWELDSSTLREQQLKDEDIAQPLKLKEAYRQRPSITGITNKEVAKKMLVCSMGRVAC